MALLCVCVFCCTFGAETRVNHTHMALGMELSRAEVMTLQRSKAGIHLLLDAAVSMEKRHLRVIRVLK